MTRNLIALLLLVLPAWLPAQRPAEVTVRMRLFAATQPSAIDILRDNTSPQRVRADGATLLAGGRNVPGPLRLTPPLRIRMVGASEIIALHHPTEVTARNGALIIVSAIPREDYVAGVLAGEAAVFRSEESLKAMAVAARTYAAFHAGRHKAEGFDFCDTTHCQDYRGIAITPRVEQAVSRTRHELLWNRGAVFEALYHQDCGGIIEAHEPNHPPVHDAYCTARGRKQWVAELTRTELQSALALARVENIAIAGRTASGRAASIRVDGTPARTFQAEAFRLAIGRTLGWDRLRSDLYEVRRSGDRFIFEGYGAGHGMGLCQNGAAAMGELGKSYREILAFYYPGATPGQTASGIAWIRTGGVAADLESTQRQDSSLLGLIEQQMRRLAQITELRYENRPLVRIYPTVAAYRDATGEPGWIAASTRGNIIRLQPSETLRSKGILETTIRHELAHVLVESKASRSLPRWFREGFVLWLAEPSAAPASVKRDLRALDHSLVNPSSESELRQAYRDALSEMARLIQQYGRETVLSWLGKGLPPEL